MVKEIEITPTERNELEFRVRSKNVRASDRRRARLILMLASGASPGRIQATLSCSATFITLWTKRFETGRLAGLLPRHSGGQPRALTPKMEARILSWTRRRPPGQSGSWTLRTLAKVLGVNHMLVARAWDRAGIRPHSTKRYMLSRDPEFARTTADIIGMFLGPVSRVAVFRAEPWSPIQLLQPVLADTLVEEPCFPRGARALREALKTRRVQVEKAVRRRQGASCARFLEALLEESPSKGRIHVLAHGLSAEMGSVAAFRNEHPEVALHLSATFSGWLNQVEMVFSKIERDFAAGGTWDGEGLGSSLMRYLRLYCKDPRLITWQAPFEREAGLHFRKLATRDAEAVFV